jgi:hypothetical protein
MKPQLIHKVREQGFGATYPELVKVMGNKAKADILFMAVARTYLLYVMMLVPQFVTENYGLIRFGIGMMTVTEESLREYERKNFDPIKARQERFESWKGGYEAFNGPLNENNPAHVKLIRDKIQELENMADNDFRVFR